MKTVIPRTGTEQQHGGVSRDREMAISAMIDSGELATVQGGAGIWSRAQLICNYAFFYACLDLKCFAKLTPARAPAVY